jgi:hypothetical protein
MHTSGFYRVADGEIQAALGNVHAPEYTLLTADKDTYTYPVDGWYWFDSYAKALQELTTNPRRITRLAFLSRFTDAEAITIDLASQGATVQAASMRRYLSKVNTATYIDLDRPDTRGGVQALEAATLLGAGRATAILDTPTTVTERYVP